MERARVTWTDERLDDLAHRVDDGFKRLDEDLRSLRTDLGGRIDRVEGRIDAQGRELGARIDALQRTMIQLGGATMVAILATLLSVIATRG
jgi:hypothetical protein